MMKVYLVQYGPGEPDGVYTCAICATKDRAELELTRLVIEDGMYEKHMFVEETEVLE